MSDLGHVNSHTQHIDRDERTDSTILSQPAPVGKALLRSPNNLDFSHVNEF